MKASRFLHKLNDDEKKRYHVIVARRKKWYLAVAVTFEVEPRQETKVMGVDLGSRNAVPFFQRTDRSTFLHAKGAPFPVDCFFRPAKTSPFRPVPNKTE
ncbi:hypothetical protein P9851_12115 [Geobacillus stearothermophilus]|uniref:hypothetical protein n=1 Tax=Geobacillus stearothermophilus TaxID=1422 RepID=UPI002E212517|nr:hypothetical protein [Geobacillus stearothermophilus]